MIVIRRAEVTCKLCGTVGTIMGSPDLIDQACEDWATSGHSCKGEQP